MNLVNNARDASGTDSPRVHISVTRVVELPPFFLGGEAPAPGDYVAVAVRDYGVGISPEALARLAEPFYTTKSSARGTGLGLASISHTCREAGGALTAISTMGEGSVFTILLPFAGTLPNHAIPVRSNAPISETAGAERLTGPITG
jgi:signal transduction histidine kinase